MHGYHGKVLLVDLGSGRMEELPLGRDTARAFIGGSGLGAHCLHERVPATAEPLGESNALIFMAGPFAGTKAFSGDRFQVVSKSPLTGVYGEASCGGRWGSALRSAGYDGLVLTGTAERPVILCLEDGNASLEDAGDLWGQDTFATQEALSTRFGKGFEAACIGPAGEKLVRYAAIQTSGVHSRMAARAGLGAVMGAKRLKAVVAGGDQKVSLADPEGFLAFWREFSKQVPATFDAKDMRDNGTAGTARYCDLVGDLPVRNWTGRRFPGIDGISAEALKAINVRRYYCGGCLVGCGRTVDIPDGPFATSGPVGGPEYETIAMLGSNLLVGDIRAVAKANELCNRYGLDTISAGSVLGMAMECYERGIVTRADLDGVDLTWGNAEAVLEVLHRIGRRQGIGELLGEGTRRIAEAWGPPAAEFAVHVKGLEAPAHDPRAKSSLALAYATSNRGACHLQAFGYDFEHLCRFPDMGVPEPLDRFAVEGKPAYVARMENLMSMLDSLCCCKFMLFCSLTVGPLVRELELITGFGLDREEFLKTGERIFNLKRLYNVKCGVSRIHDVLPPRLLTLRRGSGEEQDRLPPAGAMLEEYYRLRGWDEIGHPTSAKLAELGLR